MATVSGNDLVRALTLSYAANSSFGCLFVTQSTLDGDIFVELK